MSYVMPYLSQWLCSVYLSSECAPRPHYIWNYADLRWQCCFSPNRFLTIEWSVSKSMRNCLAISFQSQLNFSSDYVFSKFVVFQILSVCFINCLLYGEILKNFYSIRLFTLALSGEQVSCHSISLMFSCSISNIKTFTVHRDRWFKKLSFSY